MSEDPVRKKGIPRVIECIFVTGLARNVNFQLPRPVWEAEYFLLRPVWLGTYSFNLPDQSGKLDIFFSSQTGLGRGSILIIITWSHYTFLVGNKESIFVKPYSMNNLI